MRLVTSMGTTVDGQGATLNESLVTRFVVASIGAFIGMYSVMSLEIGFSIETLQDTIAISVQSYRGIEVELSAQYCLPLGNLDAIRTERAEWPCRQQRFQL